MTETIAVEREDNTSRGRYVIRFDDATEAELTYTIRADGTRVADHTYVPDNRRGQGLAEKLVNALIADARDEGFKVDPVCSYVVAQFRRHQEWADLHAG